MSLWQTWLRWRRRGPQAAEQPVAWIDVPALRARLRRGSPPLIVDVRGPDEFTGELGRIEGAINIPMDELPTRLRDHALPEAGPIVLVCKTQMRSAKAADLLMRSGFRDIAVLSGGMVEWARTQPDSNT